MFDWTYNGPAGTVAKYWSTIQQRLESAGGAQLGKLNEVPFESIFQSVGAAVTAKSGPAFATWYADYFTFTYANSKDISPLDGYVGSGESDNWLLASTKFGDAYYAVPHVVEALVLVANRKLLDQAGVQVESGFDSYDAFIEACDKLKAAGIIPIQAGTSDGVGAEGWFMFQMLQYCNSPAEVPQAVAGEVAIEDSLYPNAVQASIELRDKYMNSAPNDDTNQDAADKFLRGEAAMALLFPSAIADPALGDQFEVLAFPDSNAKFSRPALATGDPIMIMSYADEDQKKAAGEILDFVHQPEQLKLWWDLTGSLPADVRFDSSVLPERLKTLWGLITDRPGDDYSLWWPDNFYPSSVALPVIGVIQQMFAGASDESATLTKIDDAFASFRKQDAGEVETVKAFAEALPS